MQEEERTGSLTVIGTGIQTAAHLTPACRTAVMEADLVVFAAADPWTVRLLHRLNPKCASFPYPRDRRARSETYRLMTHRVLSELRHGLNVCAAFYGHASFLVGAARRAVLAARSEGFRAEMLPGISSFDCLLADLCLDPCRQGTLLSAAGVFSSAQTPLDGEATLILFQLSMLGDRGFHDAEADTTLREGLERLVARLRTRYPADHGVILYEASRLPTRPSRQDVVPLSQVPNAPVSDRTTLIVPPLLRIDVSPCDLDTPSERRPAERRPVQLQLPSL